MSYSVHVWAEVLFPSAARPRWERLSLGSGEELDWADASLLEASTETVTVEAMLKTLRDRWSREQTGFDYVSFDLGATKLSLRALLGEDAFIYWGAVLATLVRLAGTVGATGELAAMTEEGDAERIVLDGEGGRVEEFFAGDMCDLESDFDYAALFEEVSSAAPRRGVSPAEAELHAAATRKKKRSKRSR